MTSGSVLQFAIPIKVTALGATAAASSLDIISIQPNSGIQGSPVFEVRQNGGVLRTTSSNGWPAAAAPISTTAFDATNTGNWRDVDGGRYHLLAFRVSLSLTAGAANYKIYDINPATGVSTLLQSYTGATNTVVPTSIGRVTAALCIAGSAVSNASTRALVDDVTFWDDTFASDALFISAVLSKYSVAPPSGIEGWDLY